ncbi:MAG: motif domain protein [Pseudomonadota bacterium]|nr:motif domain protein [Pseudomonadota bacterium]
MNKEEMAGHSACPCGSRLQLEECCLPRISGQAPAGSAEALMRSRYTAYVLGRADYLAASWHPSTRPPQLSVSGDIEWSGLEVLACQSGSATDSRGRVEFIARYRQQGRSGQVHENSRFVQEQGRWFYLDGDLKTVVSGRNAPCTCGSGKKFKKCCGK